MDDVLVQYQMTQKTLLGVILVFCGITSSVPVLNRALSLNYGSAVHVMFDFSNTVVTDFVHNIFVPFELQNLFETVTGEVHRDDENRI